MSQLRCFVRVHARNRHSMAAVMAVLQAELEPELLSLHLAASPEQIKPPALVLYSFMTRDVPQVAQEVSLLRRTFGHSLLLVAGGPHPSGDPEEVWAGSSRTRRVVVPLIVEVNFNSPQEVRRVVRHWVRREIRLRWTLVPAGM